MNMTEPMTGVSGMDVIVGLAVLFTVVFFLAWRVSPRLRVWVERPKYRFQADVRSYDQAQSERGKTERRHAQS